MTGSQNGIHAALPHSQKKKMDNWDTLLSERSRKFYDGTYKWNAPDGYWDERDVYHRFNDPNDPESEPPTPGPVMSLAELMAEGRTDVDGVESEGDGGGAPDTRDSEGTPSPPSTPCPQLKTSTSSTTTSLSDYPSNLSETEPANDAPEVSRKHYTRSQHLADLAKIRKMERQTRQSQPKIVTKTKTVTKTVAKTVPAPAKEKGGAAGQGKKGVARVVTRRKNDGVRVEAETGGESVGTVGRRRSARLVRR